MFRLLLRFILAVLTSRVLAELFRSSSPPLKPGSSPEPDSKPLVDRSRAIDVPFTEERTEP
ncbi:MAG TPA: hypothetical protein VET83_04025 [Candidatus Dormibacteraeota bacterium]|jgi:hypothetical protein|nr:hypothetical protein [Candidatus Dormibacteraeota bacterium]